MEDAWLTVASPLFTDKMAREEHFHSIFPPFKGLVTTYTQSQIPDEAFSSINGFWVKDAVIQSTPFKVDSTKFDNIIPSEQILYMTTFKPFVGLPFVFVFTRTNVYYWRGDQWVCINPPGITFNSSSWHAITYAGQFVMVSPEDGVFKWQSGWESMRHIEQCRNFQANFVATFKERVLLANTIEDGYPCPQRVRWSKAGSVDEWDVLDFADLTDDPTKITSVALVGDNLILFKEGSTSVCQYVGGYSVFMFPTILQDVGALKTVAFANNCFFYNTRQVYLFDGSRHLEEIGGAIIKDILGIVNDDTFLLVLPKDYQLSIIVPDNVSGLTTIFYYNYVEKAWGKEIHPFLITAACLYKLYEGATYESMGLRRYVDMGTTRYKDLMKVLPEYGALFGTNEGEILEQSFDGLDVVWKELITKDFYIDPKVYGMGKARFLWFFLELVGDGIYSLNVDYSTDKGKNWNNIFMGLWTLERKTYKLPFDVVGDFIRFRITAMVGEYMYGGLGWVNLFQYGFGFIPFGVCAPVE